MPTRTPSIIAAVLTVVILIIFGVLFLFVEVIALNGASERQGMTAMGISVVCQGLGAILSAGVAGWLTHFVMTKFNWNTVLAIFVAVVSGVIFGGMISFLSVIIAIPTAGIR